MSGLLAVAFAVAAGVARATHAPELLTAAATTVAVLVLPGWFAARAATVDPLARALLAVPLSAALVAPVTVATADRPPALAAALVLGWACLCALVASRVPARAVAPSSPGVRLGLVGVGLATAFAAVDARRVIAVPLEDHWWAEGADEAWTPAAGVSVEGARVETVVEGGERLVGSGATVHVHAPGAWLLVQAPVGERFYVNGSPVVVRAAPTVDPAEGPVARYLERGVHATRLGAHATVEPPATAVVWLIRSPTALWELHGRGHLRYAHYYQLLNIVEQVQWARELGAARWVTDVQPPLGVYLAAPVLRVTAGDLPTQNVVALLLIAATGVAGVAALRRWAPVAPGVAWLLPAAACAAHARLVIEPGSAGMPDSAYAAGIVASMAFAGVPGPGFALSGLLAQLARYPGTGVVVVVGLLAGDRRRTAHAMALVFAAAAAFGLAGAMTGALGGWLETLAWETGPEHWHGDASPEALFPRIPAFYLAWLGYAGGAPLLAALRWPPGTRVALGAALLYSLLLCTIDHHPSHYFLPLVHLAAIAAATTAAAMPRPWQRHVVASLALLGLLSSLRLVAVTG